MWKSIHTQAYEALRAELVAARRQAGFSQRELAFKLDVAHSVVAKIESGERRVDALEFCWFVSLCGADPVEAFRRISEVAGKPPTKLQRRGQL